MSYAKDFQEFFLTGKALRDGVDIFTPLTTLAARYFPAPTINFPHPSPYPPVVALLSTPLSFLPYPVVAALWFVVSVGLLVLIGRWLGLSTRASLALAAWPPIWWVLDIGQLEIGVLALTMLAWRDARTGREWRAGAWLGIAAALKFYPALFVAPFLYQRRARVVVAAVLTFALGQLANLLIVGPGGLVHYYRDIVPSVGAIYVGLGLNSSPYSALMRLLGGATDVAPLISVPSLVLPLAIGLAVGALIALFVLEPEAAPVAAFLILPTAWGYYAVLTLPLIVRLARRYWTRSLLFAAVCVSATLTISNVVMLHIPGSAQVAGSPASIFTDLFLALQPAGYVTLVALAAWQCFAARRSSPTGAKAGR